MFEGEIHFHEINAFSWAFGLAIMGHAHESLEESLHAFEQLLNFQRTRRPSSEMSLHQWEENIQLSEEQKNLLSTAQLLHLPVAAGVLWGIFQRHEDKAMAKEALRKFYPDLLNYHNEMYQERDPNEDGLITNYHPWESLQFSSDHSPKGHRLVEAIPKGYQLLSQLAAGSHPFEVQDPLFHAFLSWSNESLIQIGGVIGEDVKDIMEKYELTIFSINERLWNAEKRHFCPFDLKNKAHLPFAVLPSALCLFSEIATQDRAEELYPQLEKQLKKEMGADIREEELHPLSLAQHILLLQGLGTYGFDELSVLLLQRLSFLLQKAKDRGEHSFLIKGFDLFLQS